jgi:ATP phosphoribosyltransferase regulatory subunit
MKKMGKQSGAIGFAVYLDLLSELCADVSEYDADVLVLYDEKTDPCALLRFVGELTAEGKQVETKREMPEGACYKEIADMRGNK